MTASKALQAALAAAPAPPTDLVAEIDALRRASVPELAARYESVLGRPPRIRHRQFLWKRIAWKLQEQRCGGLSSVAKARLEELIAQLDLPWNRPGFSGGAIHKSDPERAHKSPAPGTVYERTWHGEHFRVVAVDGGFEFRGAVYKSLSAVANAATGTHWNGKLFFGLVERPSRARGRAPRRAS
ncbi:MAG: DUF2924 domain-containing protein [Planctomycetes bacterium]|nr:DUF2924 domain-containing protein [Planctomycetota bacterium]